MGLTLSERLDSHLDKTAGDDGCWIWTASTIDGYGQIGTIVNGKLKSNLAHRIAFELATGIAPGKLCVLHRCDNPPCCNPRHLFIGDRNDNCQDMMRKGRHRYRTKQGSKHGMSKLTEAQVIELRSTYAAKLATQVQLAARYKISQTNVSDIIRRRIWNHV